MGQRSRVYSGSVIALRSMLAAALGAAGIAAGCATHTAASSSRLSGSPPRDSVRPDEVAVVDGFHFVPEATNSPALSRLGSQIEEWKERYRQAHDFDYALWTDGPGIAPLWGGRTVYAAPPSRYRVRGDTEVTRERYDEYGGIVPLTVWRWKNGEWGSVDIAVPGRPDADASTSEFLVCVDLRDRRTVTAVFDIRKEEPSPLGGVDALYDLSMSPTGTWIGYRGDRRVGGTVTGGALSQAFSVEPIDAPLQPELIYGTKIKIAWLADGRAAICLSDTLVELPSGSQRSLGEEFGRIYFDQRSLTNQVLTLLERAPVLHTFGPDLQIVETVHLKMPRKGDRITSVSPTARHLSIHTRSWDDFLPGSWGRTAVCRRVDATLVIEDSVSGMSGVAGWMEEPK